MRLLFVCTGNTCRSPMAEALGRAAFEKLDVRVDVSSAGTSAEHTVSHGAVVEMRRRGLDVSAHEPRQLTAPIVSSADLVLCMSEGHRTGAVQLASSEVDANKVFSLYDFVAKTHVQGAAASQSLTDWRDQLVALPRAAGEGVADPVGQGPEVYRDVAEELDRLVGVVAAELAPFA